MSQEDSKQQELPIRMGNHGQLLKSKSTSGEDLKYAYEAYLRYRRTTSGLKVRDEESVRKLVEAYNTYRKEVVYLFEKRKNSGQEGLRSSMLEELFADLFGDLVADILTTSLERVVLGKANSYVSLTFTPQSFTALFSSPGPSIHTKDQDFVLGCLTQISVAPVGASDDERQSENTVIPVLAIECKTYLERNMLDSCAGTARRIKEANPYCLYIVAADYIKMDEAYPELTHIDEVFILCKATNSARLENRAKEIEPHPIDAELIVDLFQMVKCHFNRIWWDPQNALDRGRIIGRP